MIMAGWGNVNGDFSVNSSSNCLCIHVYRLIWYLSVSFTLKTPLAMENKGVIKRMVCDDFIASAQLCQWDRRGPLGGVTVRGIVERSEDFCRSGCDRKLTALNKRFSSTWTIIMPYLVHEMHLINCPKMSSWTFIVSGCSRLDPLTALYCCQLSLPSKVHCAWRSQH